MKTPDWAQYIQDGGKACPYCGSTSLTFSNVNGNDHSADIECVKCHESWQEFYTLSVVRVDGKDHTLD